MPLPGGLELLGRRGHPLLEEGLPGLPLEHGRYPLHSGRLSLAEALLELQRRHRVEHVAHGWSHCVVVVDDDDDCDVDEMSCRV